MTSNRIKLIIFDWTGILVDQNCKQTIKTMKKTFNK